MGKLTIVGRYFFAVGVAASGIQQLVLADFVRLVPKLPAWVPWSSFWACAVGAVLVIVGAAIAAGWRLRLAALVLGGLLLATFCLQRVPEIVANPSVGFVWTNPAKVLTLWAGTLLLAGIRSPNGTAESPGGLRRMLPGPGPLFLGVFLLICGVQHFVYADFVQTLVPAWIPPGPRFWTSFTGVALIAGGAGLLFRPVERWAAVGSGLMIFLWVLLLHLPRAVTHPQDPGETSAVFEALALSGVALLAAGAGRTRPDRTGDTK